MPLFSFDEEELESGLVDDFSAIAFEPEPAIPHDVPSLAVPDSGTSSVRIPLSRRRSSVYSRVSLKASLSSSHGIAIPADYGSFQEHSKLHEPPVASKKTLADFEPLKVLGQGAYGKVHLVRDRQDGKLYAQKQIRKPQVDVFEEKSVIDLEEALPQLPERASSTVRSAANHIHRTLAERQILSKITHHTNIVKLFYALQDEDKFYLLLEYIPGGELFHHLTSNNSLGNVFLEADVAFYAAQMALGLRHLHSLGIVYRDLKPENCLLNSAGHLVLTDFGLSKAVYHHKGEECRSIIGTPEYMAPEIIKGETYGYAVDWWSLGCVIYDMMTGKPPFTGKTHKAIQDKIVKAKPGLPFYLSLDAKDLLGKLLQKNPEKRLPVDEQWENFKKHRFFRKVDWTTVEDQSAEPPIVPVITDPALAENFSDDFTMMKISDCDLGSAQRAVPDIEFRGFSFTASHSYIDRYKH